MTGVTFDRLQGQIVVTFQDSGGVSNAGVGLNESTVIDANNYQLITVHHPRVGKYRVNVISDTPATTTGTQTVTLTINGGTYMKGGWYDFTIRSISPGDLSGVEDIAGNALDGEFYGYVPSGNNVAGGDFIAQLTAIHHTIFAPSTIIGRATPVIFPEIDRAAPSTLKRQSTPASCRTRRQPRDRKHAEGRDQDRSPPVAVSARARAGAIVVASTGKTSARQATSIGVLAQALDELGKLKSHRS